MGVEYNVRTPLAYIKIANFAGADMIGQGRKRQVDAFPRVGLALAAQRLVQRELGMEDHRQQAWLGMGGAMTGNGAGAWLIVSQARQVNVSRTC